MSTLLISLSAMLSLGFTHFVNGMVVEKDFPVRLAFFTHLGGSLVALILALQFSNWSSAAGWWGIVAGAGSACGALFLYKGLAVSSFGVVVPVSSVSMMVIALAFSMVLLGELPTTVMMMGVVIAIPGLWLVSAGGPAQKLHAALPASRGVLMGLGAGLGFAVQLLVLGQVKDASALYAIAACMFFGALWLAPYSRLKTVALRNASISAVAGGISATGLALYIFSLQGSLALTSIVIISLYPLVPVLLGSFFRKESVGLRRLAGIGLSIIATTLIALGNGY
ncbi:multidrug DMT transporter [Halomonas cupida]|uniref:Glucose uptake protein GlcU n=1 Tax=Halomonas cupida TaxID=44933 RepID=A0A1M7ILA6_9GAMM|nr:DMT family transporter [Halomonas cupida]GEN24107.1 multidrug DMT transporter [Halomonas cupida]SHM41574.1 Glucose uptake protein GlcU [Halomonas cupida]